MPDITNSPPAGLPSTRQLIRSTVIAAFVASIVLVAAVLPAEYGVDPTGIGRVLGLTEMGRIKTSLAKDIESSESAPHRAPETTPDASPPAASMDGPRSDESTVALQPDEGAEIKLFMRERARVTYTWSTDHGLVNYDLHADSKDPPRGYHGYEKGTGVATDEGELVAAFEGWHGWYWRNRGSEALVVTLRTSGDYREIKAPK